MHLVSIRLITADVDRLVAFYERITGKKAVWGNENFAELSVGPATLAIASSQTVSVFGPGAAKPAANRSAIIEFLVDDVDRLYSSLAGDKVGLVNQPTTMPWGNRSLLARDPDGNPVNLFTPVTAAAKKKFCR